MDIVKKDGIMVTFDGVEYRSYSELARTYNVKPSLFIARYKTMKWSLEQALGLEERPKAKTTNKVIVYEGKTYSSIKDLSSVVDVPYTTLCKMLRDVDYDGSRLDIGKPITYKRSTPVLTVEGVTYDSLYDLARAYGLGTVVVRSRLNVLGWTIEEAVGIVKRKNTRVINK